MAYISGYTGASAPSLVVERARLTGNGCCGVGKDVTNTQLKELVERQGGRLVYVRSASSLSAQRLTQIASPSDPQHDGLGSLHAHLHHAEPVRQEGATLPRGAEEERDKARHARVGDRVREEGQEGGRGEVCGAGLQRGALARLLVTPVHDGLTRIACSNKSRRTPSLPAMRALPRPQTCHSIHLRTPLLPILPVARTVFSQPCLLHPPPALLAPPTLPSPSRQPAPPQPPPQRPRSSSPKSSTRNPFARPSARRRSRRARRGRGDMSPGGRRA